MAKARFAKAPSDLCLLPNQLVCAKERVKIHSLQPSETVRAETTSYLF